MNSKTSYLIIFLLLVAAFLAGAKIAGLKYGGTEKEAAGQPTLAPAPTQPPFIPPKTAQPEVKFFVMSFCPFGNQAEAGLEPVYQLLKDKVSWQPRYIVSKITQETIEACKQSCPGRVGGEEAKKQCQQAIDAGQVKNMDVDTCVKAYFPYQTTKECVAQTCDALKPGSWESLHGEQELNQDVREICAFNLGNLDKWWEFVSAVNAKCNSNDVDACWQGQAKTAELDVGKISACERTQKTVLLDKEINESAQFQVTGSPTVYINETLYDGGRSPEDYKKAICVAFENPPEECSQTLSTESAGASGGCQ